MLDEWAFCTSPAPYGLGLDSATFWGSTHRELNALIEVRKAHIESGLQRWAFEQASFFNAHFRDPKQRREPWTPEEFLGRPKHVQSWNERIRMSAQLKDKARGILARFEGRTKSE